jgi:hypothetical protein
MSPVSAALELGKISARMVAGKPPSITKAPDPVKTTGTGGISTKSKDSMSMEEIYNSNL